MLNATLNYNGTANGESLSESDRDYYAQKFDRVVSEGLSRSEWDPDDNGQWVEIDQRAKTSPFAEDMSRVLRDNGAQR